MQFLHRWLRGYPIRLRMWGAIAMVPGLVTTIGVVGVWSRHRMAGLADDFEQGTHAVAIAMAAVQAALGDLRRYEKDMLIGASVERIGTGTALVEQAAAAADALQGQSQRLAQTVANFRLERA